MIRNHRSFATMAAAALCASTGAYANGTFTPTATTASLKFDSQSPTTAGTLTFGIYDFNGQQAPIFDNTSPPSNPVGIGPVDPGALATLTLASPNVLTVDVTNQDPTGFPLGYGNTTTDYPNFIAPFGAYVTQTLPDRSVTYYSDDAKNFDGLRHIKVLRSQGAGYEIGFALNAGGPYTDETVSITGVAPSGGAAVPEPASLVLIGSPMLLALRRRRA